MLSMGSWLCNFCYYTVTIFAKLSDKPRTSKLLWCCFYTCSYIGWLVANGTTERTLSTFLFDIAKCLWLSERLNHFLTFQSHAYRYRWLVVLFVSYCMKYFIIRQSRLQLWNPTFVFIMGIPVLIAWDIYIWINSMRTSDASIHQ